VEYCSKAWVFFGEVTATDQIVIALGNESVPIQLAQCRLTGLAIFKAKILIYFSNKMYGNNRIKQHSQTVAVWHYENADCSLRKKNIVSFIVICGTLNVPSIDGVTTSSPVYVVPVNSAATWRMEIRSTSAAACWTLLKIRFCYAGDGRNTLAVNLYRTTRSAREFNTYSSTVTYTRCAKNLHAKLMAIAYTSVKS